MPPAGKSEFQTVESFRYVKPEYVPERFSNVVHCQIPEYRLEVNKIGIGSGTVTSSPPGINCGIDCSKSYASDTYVTLSAIPEIGSVFTGWYDNCLGTNICSLAMNSNKTVNAVFDQLLPDFVITNITLVPTSPKINTTFTANITVKNRGEISSDGKQLTVWPNSDTVKKCSTNGKSISVGVLDKGESKTLSISGFIVGSKGTKTLQAFVDSLCTIQ